MPWFASAPAASSAATTSVCPFCAAMMSGVARLIMAEEKGGAPSKEGHESRKQRESNETEGRGLERKENGRERLMVTGGRLSRLQVLIFTPPHA